MEFAVLVILAVVLGLAAGWFFGSRPAADWRQRYAARDAEARELDEKFRRAITDLATASERASRSDALADAIDQQRREHGAVLERTQTEHLALRERLHAEHSQILSATRAELSAALDNLRADHAAYVASSTADQRRLATELASLREKAANFDEQKRLLIEAQDVLRKEFENAGAKVLADAQQAFLNRAGARFEESEKASAERLSTLLAPVNARLKSYEEQVNALEAKRVDSFGQLSGLIQSMREGQEQVRAEAARLGNSLTNAPKARGRWGERALQNVLEQCGLSEHTDFALEQSMETAEGRQRPDAIVRIPGNKQLVIDAKVSLNAYQAAFEANDDIERKRHLDLHSRSMRNHVQALGAKSYQ